MATGSLVITFLIYNIISSLQTQNKFFLVITLAIEEAQCMDFEKLYYFLPIFFFTSSYSFSWYIFYVRLIKKDCHWRKTVILKNFITFLPKKIS
jgi:hypothetical protein